MTSIFQLILAAVVARIVVGERPNQPPGFASARSTLNPLLSYSFRQAECAATSTFSEDVTGLAALTRNTTATSCPSRVASSNTFQNAVVGATIVDTLNPEALKSSTLSTTFNGLGGQLGVEIWYSFDSNQTDSVQYRLIEMSDFGGSGITPGTGANTVQLSVGITPATAGDTLTVTLAWKDSPTTTFANDLSFGNTAFRNALTSFRNTPAKTLLFLALSISDVSGNTQITAFAGTPGQSLVSATSGQLNTPLVGFAFPSTSLIRLGTTRLPTSGGRVGLSGSIHHVAFYSNTIDSARAQSMLSSGIPNSIPVVRSADFVVKEDQITAIALNQTSYNVFDFDTNLVAAFRLRSLPLKGNFSYNGQAFSSPNSFVVANVNLLTYIQRSPNNFTIAMGGSCPNGAYDSFTYVASDGLCDVVGADPNGTNCVSPSLATARLCVLDTNDLPFGSDVTVFGIRGGSQRIFNLTATDFDDFQVGSSDGLPSTYRMRDIDGNLTDGATIRFNQTSGVFGQIEFPASNGLGCNGTTVTPNQNISWMVLNGIRSFTLCFRASSGIVGDNTFEYRFTDRGGGLGPSSRVTFAVVNPLDACTAAGSGTPCESRGLETTSSDVSATLIPVNLTGTDSLIGRTIGFQITSLPLHGRLFRNAGSGATIAQGTAVAIGDNFTVSSTAQLVYVGNSNYFNFVSNSNPPSGPLYVNKDGLGIDGCVSQAISCRCNNTISGCPDTFKYIVIVTAGTPAGQSAEGIYKVYVQSKPSEFTLTAPSEFPFEANKQFTFTGQYAVSIIDPDDSVYPVSFILTAPPNSILGWSRAQTNLEQINKILFDDTNQNSCIDVGCGSTIRFVATPNVTNVLAFPSLFFNRVNVPTNNSAVTVTVIKPRPDGTTGDNRFSVESLENALRKTARMTIRTQSNTGSSDQSIAVAIYAGSGAAGFLILICCISACVWFVRKSRQAARAVRKSMASRKSQMSHRQSNLSHKHGLVDNEDMVDDMRSKSTKEPNPILFLCCWCFLGGKNADEEDREREQLALAQQRQSLASHRSSHHSVRKSQGGPGAMTPYQAAGPSYVAEPPMKGREMVAPSLDGAEMQVADDSVFAWEKHIDRRTGDVYFFNPRTGVSQWDPPTIKVRRTGK